MRALPFLVLTALVGAPGCGGRYDSTPGGDAGGAGPVESGAPLADATAPTDVTAPPPIEASIDGELIPPSDEGGDAEFEAAPPPDDLLDASFEAGPPPDIDATSPFGWMQQAMVGTWIGTRTDPWDSPATVTVTFEASGAYSAHCVVPDPSCSVWHYGGDQDLPGKTYQLFDLHANGAGEAYIEIVWPIVLTQQQGTLDNIAIDPTATTMELDFYPTWQGRIGPVHLSLVRQ